VIIAVVIVLSLVVVGLIITQIDNSSQVSSSGNQLGLTSQSIGVVESLIDPNDGNFVVSLLNNSGDVITVSNVSVGDSNVDFSEDLAQSGSKFFRVDSSVVCEEGKVVSEDVVVTYVTRDGLSKTERYPAKVMFDCSPYVVNATLLANQCPSCEVCEVCADPGFGFIEFSAPSYSAGETGIVVDSANNLVWQASSYGPGTVRTWQQAMDYCAALDLGGYSIGSWRLPNMDEVGLLYNYDSGVMYGLPFDNTGIDSTIYGFWSSTTVPCCTSYAYRLYSSNGLINNVNKTDDSYNGVRCVRSGN